MDEFGSSPFRIGPKMKEFLADLSEQRELLNRNNLFPAGSFEPLIKRERELPGAWPVDSGLHWRNETGSVQFDRGILVLGHNWGDQVSVDATNLPGQMELVKRMRRGESLGPNARWATLGRMGRELDKLADRARLDITQAFFTNAFVGLKAGEGGLLGGVGIRADSALYQASIQLFAHTLRRLRPRAVIGLGAPTALFLAHATEDARVRRWSPSRKPPLTWQGFRRVDEVGPVIGDVEFSAAGHHVTVVALTHPSLPNLSDRRYNSKEGRDACVEMLAALRAG